MSLKTILQRIRIKFSTSNNLKEYPICNTLYALSQGYNEISPTYLSIGHKTQTRKIYTPADVKKGESLETYAEEIVEFVKLYGGELSFDFLLKVPPKKVISIIGIQEHAVDYKEIYNGFIREMQNMCAGDMRKLKNFFLNVSETGIVKVNLMGIQPPKPVIGQKNSEENSIPADKQIEKHHTIVDNIAIHDGILVDFEDFVRILSKKEIKLTIGDEEFTFEKYLYNMFYENNTNIKLVQRQKRITRNGIMQPVAQ